MISKPVLKICIVVLAMTSSALAVALPFEQCEGKTTTATIKKLTVSGCTAPPCQLHKGTNVSVDVDFVMGSHAMAKNATTVVHGIIAGVHVLYPTNYKDACKTAGLKCPLKPSSESVYHAQLYVAKYDPDVNVYVEWELLDENEKDIFCFEIPVTIVG